MTVVPSSRPFQWLPCASRTRMCTGAFKKKRSLLLERQDQPQVPNAPKWGCLCTKQRQGLGWQAGQGPTGPTVRTGLVSVGMCLALKVGEEVWAGHCSSVTWQGHRGQAPARACVTQSWSRHCKDPGHRPARHLHTCPQNSWLKGATRGNAPNQGPRGGTRWGGRSP
jgi:hypothetical protein